MTVPHLQITSDSIILSIHGYYYDESQINDSTKLFYRDQIYHLYKNIVKQVLIMDQYEGLNLIYSGHSAKVFSANSCIDKQKYIIKMLKQLQPDSKKLIKQVQIHQKLKHQNIVYLKNSFNHLEKGNKYLVLVLQYCSGGSLDLIIANNELDLFARMSWLTDIAHGLEYLYHNKVIHRDIKPQNILLARGRAKIGDLGISRYFTDSSSQDVKKVGTLWYSSPETFRDSQFGYESDIWSFGIICLQVILNKRINQLISGQASPGQRKDFPSSALIQQIPSSTLRNLIKSMLSKNKQKRPTIDTVIQKLNKVKKKMQKSCIYQDIIIQLPLQYSKMDSSQPKPEWINRIDPSKQGQKAKIFKLKTTTNGKQIQIRYDHYKQSLKITYEKMEIIYQYRHLPLQFKKYFKNLGELYYAFKCLNNKIQFGINGMLIFNYRQRLEYNPLNVSQSLNRSSLSSATLNSKQDQEVQEQPQNTSNILKKNQYQPIPQVDDDHSSHQFGERLSSSAKSSERREKEKKAKKFIQSENPIPQETHQNQSNQHQQPQQPQINQSSKRQQAEKVGKPQKVEQPKPEPNAQSQQFKKARVSELPPIMLKKKPQKKIQVVEQQIVQPNQMQARPLVEQPRKPSFSNQNHPHQQPQDYWENNPSSNQKIKELQKEIEVLELVQGPQRIVLADNYVSLAHEYLKIHNFKRSQQVFLISIEKYTEHHLRYSDKCAHVLYQLGKIYLILDRPNQVPHNEQEQNMFEMEVPLSPNKKKALEYFQNSINTLYFLKSYDYKAFSKLNNKMGELYLESNQLLIAQAFFNNAFKDIKDFGGQEKKLTFNPSLNLGRTYNRMKNYHEALFYLTQCLEFIHKYKDLQLKLVFVLDELTQTYIGMRDFPKAIENVQKMAVFLSQLTPQGLMNFGEKVIQHRLGKILTTLIEENDVRNKPHLVALLKVYENYRPHDVQKITMIKSALESL